MERAHEKDGRQVFLITSCAENEGKSTVAANLALSLAQKHQRVLLLDADLRKPAQSLIFSASLCPGTDLWLSLITHRPDREALEKGHCPRRGDRPVPSLCRAAARSQSRRSARIHSVLCSMRCARLFLLILIDTPPFSFFADAEVLADAARSAFFLFRRSLPPPPVVAPPPL